MASFIHTWGTQPHERALAFPCNQLIPNPDDVFHRGITIQAPPGVVFRWLCQMRVAPYSYDWIDNGGRKSPRRLTPGLDELAPGQDVMRIFKLVDFARDRHLTLRLEPGSLTVGAGGDLAVSYCIVPDGIQACRLLVKFLVRYPRGIKGWLWRLVLPWGDLIMMRRQLLNFKELAEQTASPV
jgi:hypothetical protein